MASGQRKFLLVTINYQKRTFSYYNLGVKGRAFKEGDMILKKVEASKEEQKGKLAPNWEEPYKVQTLRGPKAYKLEQWKGVRCLELGTLKTSKFIIDRKLSYI